MSRRNPKAQAQRDFVGAVLLRAQDAAGGTPAVEDPLAEERVRQFLLGYQHQPQGAFLREAGFVIAEGERDAS